MVTVVGDFQLQARVGVSFNEVYDAGGLVLRTEESMWAKCCVELGINGRARLVSVVTRGASDDANGTLVDGHTCLQLTRVGCSYAFHASGNDRTWDLLRHFELGGTHQAVEVGFGAQAPNGPGCEVSFDGIQFRHTTVPDIRFG